MARFYKGVGVGTFFHSRDLRVGGIAPANPGATCDVDMVIQHISTGSIRSCCISVTKSYAIAENYARNGLAPPRAGAPAHVYVVDIPNPLPQAVSVIDPVFMVAARHNNPLTSPSYHHNGGQQFLLGVVSPKTHRRYLNAPPARPPGAGSAISRAPNLTPELQTLVFALRDAEVLINGNVPRAWVIDRLDIF